MARAAFIEAGNDPELFEASWKRLLEQEAADELLQAEAKRKARVRRFTL
jgi:hypothetical protein